jgi:hypothetical protein
LSKLKQVARLFWYARQPCMLSRVLSTSNALVLDHLITEPRIRVCDPNVAKWRCKGEVV